MARRGGDHLGRHSCGFGSRQKDIILPTFDSDQDLAHDRRRVLNAAYDTSLKVALEVEGHAYEKLRRTEDYIEGINAFAEKRKAVWKGR